MARFWFSETLAEGAVFSVSVERQLYGGQSDFQKIDVFDSTRFGRVLVIDGYIMLTEKDEFIYHEMITHVAMAARPEIKNALVIGGGDGGTARELVRYKTLESVHLVEIDPLVVEVSKKYLGFTARGFDDARVRVFNEDGARFVAGAKNRYDLIIVDSTDPVGPGEALFTREFYENCRDALTDGGVMVNQHESPFYEDDARAAKNTHGLISGAFPVAKVYQAHIPTYSSGHWLFGFASAKTHPTRNLNAQKWNSLGIKTRYYNTRLHEGAFALPRYVGDLLADAETNGGQPVERTSD
jgi:spermidine synthase